MFSKNTDKANTKNAPSQNNTQTYTRIGEEVHFEGNINCKGDVRIDGNLTGNINTNARVIIGPKGKILGDLICGSAEIEGKIKGKIKVNNLLALAQTANLEGEVELGKLSIVPGAKFNVSSCKMNSQNENTTK